MEPASHLRLSVALAVYNEASNLADCLESIKDLASEIIVVDGQSTDQSVAIATHYGARVISTENKSNFHINKTMAINACTGDWILQLDADERVSSMLAREIKHVLSADPATEPDAYYLKRRNYFLGRWMSKGGMYPDPVIRLFKRGRAKLPEKTVHELMEVTGVTKWLNEDLLHIADPSFSRYLLRSNRYTSLQAEDWLREAKIGLGIPSILRYLIWEPFWRFCVIFFRHKGFQDGFPGFVFAFYSGLHYASSYVKYWEKRTQRQTISMSKDWD